MSVNRRATSRGTRYDVRLRGPDGRTYKRTFRSRREAQAFEAHELPTGAAVRGSTRDDPRRRSRSGSSSGPRARSEEDRRPSRGTRRPSTCISSRRSDRGRSAL